jgi:hypothetical protein
MQVRTLGQADEVARDFIPPPATAADKPKPGTPTPVVEVDLARMNEESAPAEAPAAAQAPALLTIAAPVPAPEAKASETAPMEPVSTAVEAAAVPDAVPVAVGSSMTGALRNATESVQINEPAMAAAAAPSNHAGEPGSPQATVSSTASYTQEYGSVVESASVATQGSAAVVGAQPSGEELPPARPIAGPSGRRKTRRRK